MKCSFLSNLDGTIFSMSSFLKKANNWIHLHRQNIQSGIQDGPPFKNYIIVLQYNSIVVDIADDPNTSVWTKISTNFINSRFHTSYGAIGTITDHDLWNDV